MAGPSNCPEWKACYPRSSRHSMWLLLLEYCGPWLSGGRIARRCFEVGHDGRQSSHVGRDAESAGVSFRHRKNWCCGRRIIFARSVSSQNWRPFWNWRCHVAGSDLGVWRASANFRQFVFAIVCARWMALHISPVKCLKMLKSREAGLLIEHQEVDRRAFRMPASSHPA